MVKRTHVAKYSSLFYSFLVSIKATLASVSGVVISAIGRVTFEDGSTIGILPEVRNGS